ncbi:hypothetical protein GH714_011691 [Hevea brasiliensis]|uniref:Uncharacterized protein n=1 Tax=Hevea brasiliensis TaxID=3981 RepID=A0A6A6LPH6_HEVBR|nr:hypothetical protein GH714_011691 [Hevea brasiliensis]
MEPSNQSDKTDQKDDCFFDELEDFPFHDCAVADQSDQSTSDSTLCESSLEVSYPITTLRRRLSSDHGICNGSKDFNTESFCINSDITQTYDSKTKYKEKRHRFFRDLNERERNLDFSESTRWIPDRVDSVEVTSKVCDDDKKVKSIVNDDRLSDSVEMVDELGNSASGNLLEFIAGLVIKAIVFQRIYRENIDRVIELDKWVFKSTDNRLVKGTYVDMEAFGAIWVGDDLVRVDFLSGDGKTLSSKRQLCMLKFRSEPIRFLLTFFKLAPLVTGYMLESQILKVKFRGFKEGDVPTSCLKVIIEQRAEFRLAGGIPEIYDASLILESELPVVKWIIWSWKKTMFVWITDVVYNRIVVRPNLL